MNTAYLAIGTNLGDRKQNIAKCLDRLQESPVEIIKISPVYESSPLDGMDQPDYYNLAIKVQTDYTAQQLLAEIKSIEKLLGRSKSEKWASRIIDIDILFYNNEQIDTDTLTIPHPELEKRNFVLTPMAELDKNYIHPVTNMSISDLVDNCRSQERISLKYIIQSF